MPPIKGIGQYAQVFTFHNLNSAEKIIAAIPAIGSAVIIGAGLSGLECADALMSKGLRVAVVEKNSRVLKNLIPESGSAVIEQAFHNKGGLLYCNQEVAALVGDEQRLTGVKLASGVILHADMVVIAVGVRGNTALAVQAGIAVTPEGIVVNEYMQTSLPGIYAGGDCVRVKDQLTGIYMQSCTWPDAMQQGMVAAHNMAGSTKPYPGAAVIVSSAFFGIKFASCGPLNASAQDYEVADVFGVDFHHSYLIGQGMLKGFSLVGNVGNVGALKRALLTGQHITREQLVQGL